MSAPSVQLFPRYGKEAHLHVRMYPTHDLYNKHRGLVSTHTHEILSVSAYPFLCQSLVANFYTPSLCTCHVLQWLPRWMGVGSIHGRGDVATHRRRPFVIRTRAWLPRYKLVKSVTGSCRVVSARSYSDMSAIYERNSLRALLVISIRSGANKR